MRTTSKIEEELPDPTGLSENLRPQVHGMQGSFVDPDWPPLTLAEADRLLHSYPQAGGAVRLLSISPRPFSAGSLIQTARTPSGTLFVKRHSIAVRDVEGLLEEHRLLAWLAARTPLVHSPLVSEHGESAMQDGDWVYEVHPIAPGLDLYEDALSWTPFRSSGHARAAGRALAMLHIAAEGYLAPPRKTRQLISSYSIFAGHDPKTVMAHYLEARPALHAYAEQRNWPRSFDDVFLPRYVKLQPFLDSLAPLWTHNDFHASNLTWTSSNESADVCGIIDFGLADRTTAIHDLATAIERNVVEWLRLPDSDASILHIDHLDALVAGYEELRPLNGLEAHALIALLPLVHCEFALSETDYFLSILHSPDRAALAYEGYFLAHTLWFDSKQGRRLLDHLQQWADSKGSTR